MVLSTVNSSEAFEDETWTKKRGLKSLKMKGRGKWLEDDRDRFRNDDRQKANENQPAGNRPDFQIVQNDKYSSRL